MSTMIKLTVSAPLTSFIAFNDAMPRGFGFIITTKYADRFEKHKDVDGTIDLCVEDAAFISSTVGTYRQGFAQIMKEIEDTAVANWGADYFACAAASRMEYF